MQMKRLFQIESKGIYLTMEGDLITSYRGGFSGLDVTAVESNEDLDVMRCKTWSYSFAFEGGIVCVNYSYPCFSQAPWGGKERIDLAVNLENGDLRIT
uniref:Uncharacterized protein n=1 Tax=Helianthus annuus TaxID=4232 RepID=A0A251UTF3_HELAN